jgi:3-methyladenine DNA glycosylase Mpg
MGSICHKLFSTSLRLNRRVELMFQEAGNDAYTFAAHGRRLKLRPRQSGHAIRTSVLVPASQIAALFARRSLG